MNGGDALRAPRGVEEDCPRYSRTATANSTARIATPFASGQKLSFGELFTGLYCRTLKPVPGRPALTYRRPRNVTPAWKPRPPTETPTPERLTLRCTPGSRRMRR